MAGILSTLQKILKSTLHDKSDKAILRECMDIVFIIEFSRMRRVRL
jgi:hypothetical protein